MALHCPATLFVARHGDATYAHSHVMSDDGGWLSELGRRQVVSCAEGLRSERVAAVYGSPLERAAESAGRAAEVLDVGHQVLPGLEEIRVGERAGQPWTDPLMQSVYAAWFAGELDVRVPGAESGREVLARVTEALQLIADQHRGEQVLVFTHGGVMSFVLPRIARNVRDDLAYRKFLPNAVPARVEGGDDGWAVLTWPGSPDNAVV